MRFFIIYLLFFSGHSICIAQEIQEHIRIRVEGNSILLQVIKNENNDSILKISKQGEIVVNDTLDYFYNGGEFIDFNSDGHIDFMTYTISNVPFNELWMYAEDTDTYRFVEDFSKFSQALPVEAAKGYYYSYRSNGCADNYWYSELFIIQDFQAVRLARIYGYGCNDIEKEGSLEVRRYKNKEEFEIIETLPYDTLATYEDYKWGFIKAYWNKNIKRFR